MAESQTVIERLFEYLKAMEISPSRLEKMAGLANGYLRNSKGGLGAQKLSDILSACPDLNPTWLMTGEGEMLKSAVVESTPHAYMIRKQVLDGVEEYVHVDCPGHDDYFAVSDGNKSSFLTKIGLSTICSLYPGITGSVACAASAIGGAAGVSTLAQAVASAQQNVETILEEEMNTPKSSSPVVMEASVLGYLVNKLQSMNEELLKLYRDKDEKQNEIARLQSEIAGAAVMV